jgi:hypothetical protein
MEKVYFDRDFRGSWVVKDLSDIYSFKYIQGDEEKSTLLIWEKGIEHSECGLGKDDRLYIADVGGCGDFFFVMRYVPEYSKTFLYAKEPLELSKLLKETGIFFVGETLAIEKL